MASGTLAAPVGCGRRVIRAGSVLTGQEYIVVGSFSLSLSVLAFLRAGLFSGQKKTRHKGTKTRHKNEKTGDRKQENASFRLPARFCRWRPHRRPVEYVFRPKRRGS
jgi:hypothetical protein